MLHLTQPSSNQQSTIFSPPPLTTHINSSIDLRPTTSERVHWPAKPPHNTQPVETLSQSFPNQGVIKSSPENRTDAGDAGRPNFAAAFQQCQYKLGQRTDNQPHSVVTGLCRSRWKAIRNRLGFTRVDMLEMTPKRRRFSKTPIASDARFLYFTLAPKGPPITRTWDGIRR